VAGVAGPAIAFSVLDDGPGFAPGGTARAFERFYRGDPARTGPGSGLGLSIVRELALAHGGTAIAENLSPRGARVSVVLPVAPPERGSTHPIVERVSPSG
jgi:signal transduction histidine kinase